MRGFETKLLKVRKPLTKIHITMKIIEDCTVLSEPWLRNTIQVDEETIRSIKRKLIELSKALKKQKALLDDTLAELSEYCW